MAAFTKRNIRLVVLVLLIPIVLPFAVMLVLKMSGPRDDTVGTAIPVRQATLDLPSAQIPEVAEVTSSAPDTAFSELSSRDRLPPDVIRLVNRRVAQAHEYIGWGTLKEEYQILWKLEHGEKLSRADLQFLGAENDRTFEKEIRQALEKGRSR